MNERTDSRKKAFLKQVLQKCNIYAIIFLPTL